MQGEEHEYKRERRAQNQLGGAFKFPGHEGAKKYYLGL